MLQGLSAKEFQVLTELNLFSYFYCISLVSRSFQSILLRLLRPVIDCLVEKFPFHFSNHWFLQCNVSFSIMK